MLQSFAFRSTLLGRLARRPAWNRQARDLTGLSPSGLRLQLAEFRLIVDGPVSHLTAPEPFIRTACGRY